MYPNYRDSYSRPPLVI